MSLRFMRSHIDLDVNIGSEKIQDMQDSFYGNINRIDPRRRPEQEDRGLLAENHTQVANLPQEGYQIEFEHEYKPRYLRQ